MKLLFDLMPIIVFFALYKTVDIYAATAATMAVAVVQTAYYWFKHRKFDYLLLGSTALIVVLGLATLYFKNEMFIKWKPTAISWLFACAFLVSQFIAKKPLIQITLESLIRGTEQEQMTLPEQVWRRLNMFWVSFYFLLGACNVFVAYHFDTDTWVNFKLFGLLGLNIGFVIVQALYLAKQLRKVENV